MKTSPQSLFNRLQSGTYLTAVEKIMKMDNLNSYTSSFGRWQYFELSKSVYNLEGQVHPTRIGNIHVYLKLQLSEELNITLHPHISFDGRHELTAEEWNTTFVEKAELIRNFFHNPSNAAPLRIASNRLHVHTVPELTMQSMLLLLSDYEEPMIINCLEWANIDRVMECVNARIKHLSKIKSTYENRINFFKKHLKMLQPTNLQEAYQLINRVCNKDNVVDSEIKYYALEFLYNISVL